MTRRQKDLFPELPGGKKYLTDIPELMTEWHPTKNVGLNPDDITHGSKKKAWWVCSEGHEWEAVISNRTIGRGCPYCAGKLASAENNLEYCNPELMQDWNYEKNDILPSDLRPKSNQKVWWKCSKGHEWQTAVYHRVMGTGCPKCFDDSRSERMRPKTSDEYNLLTENPTVCQQWDFDRNKFPPTHYLSSSSAVVWWSCDGGEDHKWRARIDSRTEPNDGVKNGCPFCAGRRASKGYNLGVQHPRLLEEWHPTLNETTPYDYTPSSNYKVWWLCNKGHEWEAAINNRSSGRNCPTCSNKSSRNEIRLLTELKALFGNVLSRCKLEQYEVDIFLPDLDVAIEYDGWWWHKDSHEKDRRKQVDVTNAGFKLIRVRETPLPSITLKDIFVDGGATISKPDVASVVRLISEAHHIHYTASNEFLNDELYRVYLDYFPSPFPEHSLAEQNPTLASEWHPTKNKPLTPANFGPAASYRAWWLCSEGHEWEATINNRSKRNCPYCSGRYATSENSMQATNPELVPLLHPTKNGDVKPTNIKASTGKLLWWRCSNGHEWRQRGYALLKNTGEPCPKCRAPSMSDTDPAMAAAFHSTLNGELSPSDLPAGTGKRIWWQCSKDSTHVWQSTGSNLKKVSRPDLCPACRRKVKRQKQGAEIP